MIKVNRVSHEKEGRLSEIQFSAQLRYLSLRDFLEFNSLFIYDHQGKNCICQHRAGNLFRRDKTNQIQKGIIAFNTIFFIFPLVQLSTLFQLICLIYQTEQRVSIHRFLWKLTLTFYNRRLHHCHCRSQLSTVGPISI